MTSSICHEQREEFFGIPEHVLAELLPIVRKTVSSLVFNVHDAEDLVGEALLKVLSKYSTVPPVENPKAWGRTVATNVVFEWRRKPRLSCSESLDVAFERCCFAIDENSELDSLSAQEAIAKVGLALAAMEGSRDTKFGAAVFRAHFVNGQSYKEIADSIGWLKPGLTVDTVRYACRKTLSSLRIQLAQSTQIDVD